MSKADEGVSNVQSIHMYMVIINSQLNHVCLFVRLM